MAIDIDRLKDIFQGVVILAAGAAMIWLLTCMGCTASVRMDSQGNDSLPDPAQVALDAGGDISGVITDASPLLPWPWNLIAGVVGAAGTAAVGAASGKRKGVSATAGPIEAARRRDLEDQLGKDGEQVIVFEKGVATVGHDSQGVLDTIKRATE